MKPTPQMPGFEGGGKKNWKNYVWISFGTHWAKLVSNSFFSYFFRHMVTQVILWQPHQHKQYPPTQLCFAGATVCSLTMTQVRELITVKNKPALCFVFLKDYVSTRVRSPIYCSAVQTVVSAQGAWIADGYPRAQSQRLHSQLTSSFTAAVEQDYLPNWTRRILYAAACNHVEGLFNETKWGHTDVYLTSKAWPLSSLELLLVLNYMSFLQFARWNKYETMTNKVTNVNEQLWAKIWNETLPEIA